MVWSRDAEFTERSRGGSQRSAATGLVRKWWRLSDIRSFRIVGHILRTDKPRILLRFFCSGNGGFQDSRLPRRPVVTDLFKQNVPLEDVQ